MTDAPETFAYDISERIRAVAMALPEASEGTSCVNRAFRAAKKNFAFLGEKEGECGLRVKLADSIPEVTERAASEPERYDVGTAGWTMMRFPPEDPPDLADLERWVIESYRLLTPKRLSTQLDD